MSDAATRSEIGQVLDELKSMRSDIQTMDKKLDIHIAETKGQFNEVKGEIKALDTKVDAVRTELKTEIKAVNEKVDSLRSELREDVNELNELRAQQRSTDGRLWAFVAGLVTLLGGSLITGLVRLLWVRQLI